MTPNQLQDLGLPPRRGLHGRDCAPFPGTAVTAGPP
jgi:hypothetical protein